MSEQLFDKVSRSTEVVTDPDRVNSDEAKRAVQDRDKIVRQVRIVGGRVNLVQGLPTLATRELHVSTGLIAECVTTYTLAGKNISVSCLIIGEEGIVGKKSEHGIEAVLGQRQVGDELVPEISYLTIHDKTPLLDSLLYDLAPPVRAASRRLASLFR